MTPDEEETISAYEDINITSYITTIPSLIVWLWTFIRIMGQKDRHKFFSLTLICVLMITSQLAFIIGWQLNYTYTYRFYSGDLESYRIDENIL